MANTAFNKKNPFFHQQTGLKFKEASNKALLLKHSFLWCGDMDTSESNTWEVSECGAGEGWRRSF